MLAKPSSLQKGLPKTTRSLCPECLNIIPARIFEQDGKVMMEKECPDHGKIVDVYWSDKDMYLRAERFAYDGIGIENPAIPNATVCPNECGLCQLHLTHTCLTMLDLTNRCNLKCPICFANANAAGYVYEPSFDEIVKMLQMMRDERPVRSPAIQFSGGEPTIYPRFIDVIAKAKEMGFPQIMAATNGIKFAKDPEFLKAAVRAGMNTIYLQFDGLRDDVYKASRGAPLLETKLKVVENVQNLERPPSVVLVPTVVKNVNDDQVGEIVKFALKNVDVVRGVNFQPVAFTGRIDQEERSKHRYTLPDLVKDLESQTAGQITRDDFFPVPAVVPISTVISALLEQSKVTLTSHPHCGMATYVFVKDENNVVPLTRFVEVEPLFRELYELSVKAERSKVKFPSKVKALNILKKHIIKEKVPDGLSTAKFLQMMDTMFNDSSKGSVAKFSWSMMFIGGMHFLDNYNYDIERVKRCAIHYSTPDGRIIPFCAYNGGPTYRTEMERKFSVPIAEWRKKHGGEYT
ncbi:MAG: radical SAM protein [Methanomassiliicoccus sp.]|nr:radical SAM protein [Methanomassiliicoccus sp.]